MTKEHILSEIRRTAEQNGGKPYGVRRFETETGIKASDWAGVHWVRWRDALKEAGYQPNQWQQAHGDDQLLKNLAALAKELGHFPLDREIKLKDRRDTEFPSHNTFRRFGGKREVAKRLRAYCLENGDEEVAMMCIEVMSAKESPSPEFKDDVTPDDELGFVYLLKSGRYYKIGRTNAVGRRERELGIQLPEKAALVHEIKTDDPPGIEKYWHERFAAWRKNGDWFELTAKHVADFRRRKFM